MSKWISVENRLPLEVKDLELADGTQLKYKCVDVIARMNHKENGSGVILLKFYVYNYGHSCFYHDEDHSGGEYETSLTKHDKTDNWVTHWMPVPLHELD